MRGVVSVVCLSIVGCGGPAGLGSACDLEAETPCADEFAVCADNADGDPICQRDYGTECDLGADDAQCVYPSECVAVLEDDVEVGRCYVAEGGACDASADTEQCAPELTCAEITDGSYECHEPVVVRGRVFDLSDDAAIEGAHVLGLDDSPIAVTDIAVSIADGSYALELPVVRDTEGTPQESFFTLRSSADAYETFPGGIRTALPINTTIAVQADGEWTIEGTVTDIALLPLEDVDAPRVSISGTVVAGDLSNGVLVVAEGTTTRSAITGADGSFTVFNVPPGEISLRGYRAGLQVTPLEITAADADLEGQDLLRNETPLNSLTGSLQFVNSPTFDTTSVVLAVKSTFSDTFGRGDVPAGLRDPTEGPVSVMGSFMIDEIPDGTYVILASFENDGGVRDPDTNIAGTETLTLTLPDPDQGNDVTIQESFKVTEALEVLSPGVDAPEAVTSAPVLSWADDSSEEYHQLQVFDAYGNEVWGMAMVTAPGGNQPLEVPYAGPLDPGMFYQFRATSWRAPGGDPAPISRTEDLRGVFFVP
jgi:hypothetical protein